MGKAVTRVRRVSRMEAGGADAERKRAGRGAAAMNRVKKEPFWYTAENTPDFDPATAWQRGPKTPQAGPAVPPPQDNAFAARALGNRAGSAGSWRSYPEWRSMGAGRDGTRTYREIQVPTLAGRAADTLSGAAKLMGSNFVNTVGTLFEAGNAAETGGQGMFGDAGSREAEARRERADIRRRIELMEEGYREQLASGQLTEQDTQAYQEALRREQDRLALLNEVERARQGTARETYALADRLGEAGGADVESAKEGLGTAGRFAVDVGVAGAQMLGDAALGTAGMRMLGASGLEKVGRLGSMALRSFGGSAQEARQAGASRNQQLAYGLGSGITSVVTEKLGNLTAPFAKAFGKGVSDELVETLIGRATERFARTALGRTALNGVLRTGASFIEEGGEEFLEDVIDPFLRRGTFDREAQFDFENAVYDFLVGGALGGLGGAVETASNAQADYRRNQGRVAGAAVDQAYDVMEREGPFSQSSRDAVRRAQEKFVREDAAQGPLTGGLAETAHGGQDSPAAEATPKMRLEDFTDIHSPVWTNVDYDDKATQQAITEQTHWEMVDRGEVVQVPESTIAQTAEYYPDLRTMKKDQRNPIIRQKMNELKAGLRQFLSGLKENTYQFEVKGNILEARLYDPGIREVLEKVTQNKAAMLRESEQIFRGARYLYSTPDYGGNPNIYRWNYFYTPVQIGDETVGVRIAVRDIKKKQESQIYNWGIKKGAALDDGGGENISSHTGVSSTTPASSISTAKEKVNRGMGTDPKRAEAEAITQILINDFAEKYRMDAEAKKARAQKERAEAEAITQILIDDLAKGYRMEAKAKQEKAEAEAITQMLINDWAMKLREEAEANGAYAEAGTSGGLVYDDDVRENPDSAADMQNKATERAEDTAPEDGRTESSSGTKQYAGMNMPHDRTIYTYNFLTSLPDMKKIMLPEVDTVCSPDGKVDTGRTIVLGMNNARNTGMERNGKVFVQNVYTGRDLRVDISSIRHGLNGGLNRLLTNARLGAVIGDVVKNAVPVNALHNKAKGVSGTYAMAAYATDSRGREFVAIITVEQRTGNVSGMVSHDVAHAVSGRQKNRSERADTRSQGVYPSTNASYINIADLLKAVKSTHQSVLSEDVLEHFGEQRSPGGFYTGRVRFDLKKQQGKNDAALDGGEPGYNPNITGVSSATPVSSIFTAGEKANKGMETDPKRIEAEAITQMLINDWAMKLREEAEANGAYAEAGMSGGLVYDEYVRDNLDSTTAEKIHSTAKMLGTRVRFVDNVRNGTANAQINGREVLVEKSNPNPVMFLLGHEWTHRIQELAPAEYRAFREAAAEETQGEARILLEAYREAGEAMDYEAALDEAAANYAGRMIEDGQVLEEFIQRHRQDRTLLERVRDALRQLADKLSGEYRRMAQTAEGRLAAALEEAARQIKRMEGQGYTAWESEDVHYSIKYDQGNHPYVAVDSDILSAVPKSQWVKTVKDHLRKRSKRYNFGK